MVKINISEFGYDQVPNYCTQAIETIAELARRRTLIGLAPDLELLLCDLMRDAVKFLLPLNGYMLREHDFKPSRFEVLQSPYQTYALEFKATREIYAANSGLAFAEKRIVLCFDPWALPQAQLERLSQLCRKPFLASVPERCLALMAVYEVDGVWNAAVGAVVIDLDKDKPMMLTDPRAQDLRTMGDQVGKRLQTGVSAHALPATFYTFPARSEPVGQSPEAAYESLYTDTLDEVRAAFEFLAVVNMTGVGTLDLPAPHKLNEKRLRNGRPPFYPYKVLDRSPTEA